MLSVIFIELISISNVHYFVFNLKLQDIYYQ